MYIISIPTPEKVRTARTLTPIVLSAVNTAATHASSDITLASALARA